MATNQNADNKNIQVNFTESNGSGKDHINISIEFTKSIAVDKGAFEDDDEIKEYIQDLSIEINEALDLYIEEIHAELAEDEIEEE